jgi:hypothetical protein
MVFRVEDIVIWLVWPYYVPGDVVSYSFNDMTLHSVHVARFFHFD